MEGTRRPRSKAGVEQVLEDLSCPICFELLTTTRICPRSHTICGPCFQHLPKVLGRKNCPMCLTPFSLRKVPPNGLFEDMMKSITVPCSYTPNGCTQVLSLNTKETHERTCPFTPVIKCPVLVMYPLPIHGKDYSWCDKLLRADATLVHITNKHQVPVIQSEASSVEVTFEGVEGLIADMKTGHMEKVIIQKQGSFLVQCWYAVLSSEGFDIMIVQIDERQTQWVISLEIEKGWERSFVSTYTCERQGKKPRFALFHYSKSEILRYLLNGALLIRISICRANSN